MYMKGGDRDLLVEGSTNTCKVVTIHSYSLGGLHVEYQLLEVVAFSAGQWWILGHFRIQVIPAITILTTKHGVFQIGLVSHWLIGDLISSSRRRIRNMKEGPNKGI